MSLRMKFWNWAHRRAEALWHWIYYNKIAPRKPKESGIYWENVRYLDKSGRGTEPK